MDVASQQPVLAGSLPSDQGKQPPVTSTDALTKVPTSGPDNAGREMPEDNRPGEDSGQLDGEEAMDAVMESEEDPNANGRHDGAALEKKSSLPPRKRRREEDYGFKGEGEGAPPPTGPQSLESAKGPLAKVAAGWKSGASHLTSPPPSLRGAAEILCGLSPLPSEGGQDSKGSVSAEANPSAVPVMTQPVSTPDTGPVNDPDGGRRSRFSRSSKPADASPAEKPELPSASSKTGPTNVGFTSPPGGNFVALAPGPFNRVPPRDQVGKVDDRDMDRDRERSMMDPRKKVKPFGGAPVTPVAPQNVTPPSRPAQVRTQAVAISRDQKPPPGACNHCMETESPQWRKGPPDKPHLCNACGTRYLRTGSLQHSGHRRGNAKAPSRGGGGGSAVKSQNSDGSNKARSKSSLGRSGSSAAAEAAAAMLAQDVSEGRTQRELRPRVPPPPPIAIDPMQQSGDPDSGRGRRRRANSSSQPPSQQEATNGGAVGAMGLGPKAMYDRGENSGMADPTGSPGESAGFAGSGGAKRVGGRRSMRRARRDVSNSADMWASPRGDGGDDDKINDGVQGGHMWGYHGGKDDLMGDEDEGDEGRAEQMAAAGASLMGMAGVPDLDQMGMARGGMADLGGAAMGGTIPSMAQLEAVAAAAATSHLAAATAAGTVTNNPAAAAAAAAAAAMCRAMGLSAEVGAAAACQAMRAFREPNAEGDPAQQGMPPVDQPAAEDPQPPSSSMPLNAAPTPAPYQPEPGANPGVMATAPTMPEATPPAPVMSQPSPPAEVGVEPPSEVEAAAPNAAASDAKPALDGENDEVKPEEPADASPAADNPDSATNETKVEPMGTDQPPVDEPAMPDTAAEVADPMPSSAEEEKPSTEEEAPKVDPVGVAQNMEESRPAATTETDSPEEVATSEPPTEPGGDPAAGDGGAPTQAPTPPPSPSRPAAQDSSLHIPSTSPSNAAAT